MASQKDSDILVKNGNFFFCKFDKLNSFCYYKTFTKLNEPHPVQCMTQEMSLRIQ